MQNRQRMHMRAALYASAAIAGLIASPVFAQSEAVATGAKGAEQTITLAQAGQAPAASAPQTGNVIQEVVVTGIRKGIQDAIRAKKRSDDIVEAVSAEDIGKLPDDSIADSIARLPGLTAQRLNGRDQVISIRGFGPDFSTALLNGREQVTTGNNRGVEYDQYPSELMSSVVVAKTPDAALVGQGLVGTVELNTLRPLDQPGRVLSVQARGDLDSYKALNPGTDNTGYRFSGFYSDKFANDTLGVALGVATQSTPTQNRSYNAWGFPHDANNNYVLGGGKEYGQSDQMDRTGVVGTLEYKPNERFHSTFDAFYSDFSETDYLRGVEFPLFWGGCLPVNPAPAACTSPSASSTAAQGGIDTKTTFSNVYPVQRNDYDQRKATTFSLGWNNKFEITNTLRANLDLSWSKARRTDFLLESYSGSGYKGAGAPDTVTATRKPDGTYSLAQTLSLADPTAMVLTDPQGWGGNYLGDPVVQGGYVNKPSFTDDLKAIRLDFEGDLNSGPFKSWDAGVNVSRRQKDSNFTADFLTFGNDAAGQPITSMAIPQKAIIGPASPIGFLGVSPTLALDPLYLYNHVYTRLSDQRPVSLVDDYLVREDVELYYAKLNIHSNVLDIPVRGNVGFQIVHTEQFSTGKSPSINTKTTPNSVIVANISGSDHYTNFLPSLNLIFDIAHDTDIRFGAARTLARPRLDQEEITSTITTNINYLKNNNPKTGQTYFGGTGGNIHLHPYISDGVDLTFERYFGSLGYFSVQGFYKHLTQYVNPNRPLVQDFTAAIPLFLTPAQAGQLGTPLGLETAPSNTGFGDIFGLEVTLSMPLKLVWTKLDGFGVELSGSVVDSEVKYQASDPNTLPIEGQSKNVVNSTFYYEKNGFQARVSARYRSRFLGEISGLSASRVFTEIAPETIVDAQIGYTFQSGPLKNLGILLEGKNLTDQPFVTYTNGDPRLVTDYQKYGPTFEIGASYKF